MLVILYVPSVDMREQTKLARLLEVNSLSPLSMERVLERFRRRLCLRVFRAEHALLLKKNASTIRLMHEFSRERQPLHCDVIVGKQIIFN